MEEVSFYFTIGWQHILSFAALDHLLFLIALIALYTVREWKQVLLLITAFTIGHSITLVLSSLAWIQFSTKWVEFLIPCTIIFTALFNVTQKNKSISSFRLNYFFALGFGLIHGMGFANSIRFMIVGNQNLGLGLLGFNLGVELGQVLVVAFILLIASISFTVFKIKRPTWILALSILTGIQALNLAIQRFPFF
ncbi:MAG: HupE/UreJ family protein [Chitinophagaceae bacterium]|nr:MAG: HupE/UreJ family protein [Chitinophagaceae bacterium]